MKKNTFLNKNNIKLKLEAFIYFMKQKLMPYYNYKIITCITVLIFLMSRVFHLFNFRLNLSEYVILYTFLTFFSFFFYEKCYNFFFKIKESNFFQKNILFYFYMQELVSYILLILMDFINITKSEFPKKYNILLFFFFTSHFTLFMILFFFLLFYLPITVIFGYSYFITLCSFYFSVFNKIKNDIIFPKKDQKNFNITSNFILSRMGCKQNKVNTIITFSNYQKRYVYSSKISETLKNFGKIFFGGAGVSVAVTLGIGLAHYNELKINNKLQEKQFDEELSLQKKQFDEQISLQKKQFDEQISLQKKQLTLQEKQLNLQEKQLNEEISNFIKKELVKIKKEK